MATEILMPQLGESVTEGTIGNWLVKPGDIVKKYDSLCEVTTDKVNAEVPSSVSGRVSKIVVPEGETVAVGTLICYIEAEGSEGAAAEALPQETVTEEIGDAYDVRPDVVDEIEEKRASAPTQAPAQTSGGPRYSPAVLRLSQEHGIDLSSLAGSGLGGRITRKDVFDYIEKGPQHATQAAPASHQTVAQVSNPSDQAATDVPAQAARPTNVEVTENGDHIIPVTQVRKTIAQRMVQSKHDAPHAWTMVEADVTSLVNYRNSVKDEFKSKEGFTLTFLPFFIKAVVESLKEYPIINSTWAGDKIIIKKRINISIAVATEDALFVPVIHDADQKSILGIAKSIDELAKKARSGKLSMADMQGGTFTVNNTGSFGSVLSAPIINSPQAAIVSMESIVKKPVVINDMIAVRSMANLCLSLDHRVLDGLVCGKFLQSVKTKLESYGPETKLY